MTTIDISHLSSQEWLDLLDALCDSLADETWPLSDALKADLDRRNARFAEDRARAVLWSEVREKLRPLRA
jgi:putative addiction module component (TIGR02574 family)